MGRNGDGHTLPLPGRVGGTGAKCLDKTGVVLGTHYRGHRNKREDDCEEMRGQGQKAARKFHLESRVSSPERLKELCLATVCGSGGAVCAVTVALPVALHSTGILAVPTG